MRFRIQDSRQIPLHFPLLKGLGSRCCEALQREAGDYISISLCAYLLVCIFLFMIVLFPIESHSQAATVEGQELWKVTENNTFVEIEGVPQYKIGIGDILEVDLLIGTTVERFTPVVRPNGFIVLPVLDIKVAVLTTNQAEERIKQELSKYIRVPRVEVRVKEFRSKKVVVMGAIAASPQKISGPGIYYLKGKINILEMITHAGGTLPNASLDRVQLRRADGTTLYVNFLKIFAEGDIKENVILDEGDEIYVPALEAAENKILVFGEVKKPGLYPRKPGLTLMDAIGMADGYTIYAVLRNTAVIRAGGQNSEIIVANLDKLIKNGDISQNVPLANNDIIYVPRSMIGDWNVFIEKIRPTVQLISIPLTAAVTIRLID